MIRLNSVKIPNNGYEKQPDNDNEKIQFLKRKLSKKAAKQLKINLSDIDEVIIRKHSIDARKKNDIMDVFVVDVKVNGKTLNEEKIIKKSGCKQAVVVFEKNYSFPKNRKEDEILKRQTIDAFRPIIVGAGPAGLFCAYELAIAGYCPIILERGYDIDKRQEAVSTFWNTGKLDIIGNVQFGEGGAGTFSDGKLNTMIKDKNGLGLECLKIFHKFGASESILFEAKPHIGTDVLRTVIKNIRNEIIAHGGTFYFETKVTELLIKNNKVEGVKCENGKSFKSDVVVLAIGHSARDTFYSLKDMGVTMEPKAFAIGLRVEHEQKLINKSQYGHEAPTSLPPSPYKLTARCSNGRGVYSFCMCPGGYVVNASSEEGKLCVNGMSYSGRDGSNANSAIVVTVDPSDFGDDDILAGVEFQRRLEEKAYKIADGNVPVEYFDDFKYGVAALDRENNGDDISKEIEALNEAVKRHQNENRNLPCIKGKWAFAPVHEILPLNISKSIVEGMEHFGHIIEGFDKDDALFSGVEARTSSPVRINRNDDLEAIGIEGLYPSGEGAGYAGGITSAAMDGMKVAERIAIHYRSAKDNYRNLMKQKRALLSDNTREALDKQVLVNLLNTQEYKKAEKILIFCGYRNEISTKAIITDALSKNKKVYCPKITDNKNSCMEFIRISSLNDLSPGRFSIPEPELNDDSEIFDINDCNCLVILPGLFFDKKGNRIGYGGGYYDNYLNRILASENNKNISTVAIGYDFQLSTTDFSEFMSKNDHRADMIITDKEIHRI